MLTATMGLPYWFAGEPPPIGAWKSRTDGMAAARPDGCWGSLAWYSARPFVQALPSAAAEVASFHHWRSPVLVRDASRSASLEVFRKLNVDFVAVSCKIQTRHLIHLIAVEVVDNDTA